MIIVFILKQLRFYFDFVKLKKHKNKFMKTLLTLLFQIRKNGFKKS